MKKLFSILLCTVLVLSMSVTAFAAESPATNNGGDTTIDVTGTFVASSGAGEVISVDVSWDAMEFTYSAGGEGTWNPNTHTYDGATEAGWSEDWKTITVTNHSNVAVNATLSFVSSVDGVVGTFREHSDTEDDNVLSLATAEGTSVDDAPSAEATFRISGAAIAESKTLGTITVSIAKYEIPVTTVSTEDELTNALHEGGHIKLANDISLSGNVGAHSDFSLDLGVYSLNVSIMFLQGVTGRISDGTLNGLVVNEGTLALDSCTVVGGTNVSRV